MSETQRTRVGPIGKILFDAGVVTREQVTEALDIQRAEGGKTFEILVRLGYLDKDALHSVLSRLQGIATIDLDHFKVSPDLLGLVPKEIALRELVLPIDKLGKLLTVAMACPLDVDTIDQIEQITGLKVKAMLCRYDDVAEAVEKHYPKARTGSEVLPTYELPTRHQTAATATRNLTEDVKRLEVLAAAPGVMDKLLQATQGAQPDLRAAMQTAAADPALAGWVVALANTPAYGMPSQVESLGLAVALIGADGLCASVGTLKKDAPQPRADFAAAYELSRKASLAAAILAKKSGKVDRGAAYTAALLRRLGWFTLATLAPAEVVSLISAGEAARCDEERKRFGISHLDAGALTASRWRFPEALLAAVSSPEEVKPSRANALLAVACVAATLVERGAAEGAGCLSHMPHHLTTLGLDAATAFEEVRKVIEG